MPPALEQRLGSQEGCDKLPPAKATSKRLRVSRCLTLSSPQTHVAELMSLCIIDAWRLSIRRLALRARGATSSTLLTPGKS